MVAEDVGDNDDIGLNLWHDERHSAFINLEEQDIAVKMAEDAGEIDGDRGDALKQVGA